MLILLIMMILFFMICMILMLLNFMFSKKKKLNREKNSPFECGFDPMMSSRLPFSMQFYMISIIFLIFDIEIIIFFPLIPSYLYNSLELSIMTPLMFIFILMLGLYIEWFDGALK
uniref:NADH-ubiquinone oxidoreductase chain 3 n=1 Tax=Hyposoter sp. ZJUH_2016018 TaxID=2491160 RepID=A0A3Q8UA37_9HYME|nr:NADH dehydrogenase subunit 3 [Hyposoter sp. ZJUH_2016018]